MLFDFLRKLFKYVYLADPPLPFSFPASFNLLHGHDGWHSSDPVVQGGSFGKGREER